MQTTNIHPIGRPAIVFGVMLLLGALAFPASGREASTIAQILLNANGTRTEHVRDVSARTLETLTRDNNGEIIKREVFRLNAQGDPIAATIYDPQGTPHFRVAYAYDELGRRAEEVTYDMRGQPVRRAVYTHDDSGNRPPTVVTTTLKGGTTPKQPTAPVAPNIAPGSSAQR